MHKSFKYLIPAFMAFTLAACGGSSSSKSESADYSGKTSPASFDSLNEDQKQAVGKDSATVIYEAANFSDADGMIGDFPSAAEVQSGSALQDKAKSTLNKVLAKTKQVKAQDSTLPQLPVAATEAFTDNCSGGGTTSIAFDFNERTNTSVITFTAKNCKEIDFDGSYDLTNGTVVATIKYSETTGKVRVEFKNFTDEEFYNGKKETSTFNGFYQVSGLNLAEDDELNFSGITYKAEWNLYGTINGKPVSTKGSMNCDNNGCTLGTTVQTEDGKVYKVEDFKVTTKTNGEPNTIEGKIYHPDHGYYNFTANITQMCDDDEGSPFIGTATFTDGTYEIKYTSSSCFATPIIDY